MNAKGLWRPESTYKALGPRFPGCWPRLSGGTPLASSFFADLILLSVLERMEAGAGVGLESSVIQLQMSLRMLATPVGRVGEPDGGWRRIGARAAVPHISPEPARLRASVAGRKHWNRRVVGVQLGGRHHMAANGFKPSELNSLLVQLPAQVDQMLHTAAEPIKLPDDEGVAFAQEFLCLGEAVPLGLDAAALVLKDLPAACLGESFYLQLEILILCRHTSVQ